MSLSFTLANCSSKVVFDILENDQMNINKINHINSIDIDIAYTHGIVCKSTCGLTFFEFTIYNIITPVLCSLLANWLYDKFKKHNITEIKIENKYTKINSEKELEELFKKYTK